MSDKKKGNHPTQPSLVGKKTYLRPATSDDVLNFHRWTILSEPQSMSSGMRFFKTALEVAEDYKKREISNKNQSFAIVSKEEKALVGKISYFNFNPLNRSAELGLLIDPDKQKNGYATDALKILIKFLFHSFGLNKVYAQTSAENKGAVKLLESLNFNQDGILRDHYFIDGEFQNGLIYSFMLFELNW
ncbi:MAG: GNAT family protein [candidate division Zixibacteria bacterium]|nr:GNAT family protein [candidate division Zixibacteria bacterium]